MRFLTICLFICICSALSYIEYTMNEELEYSSGKFIEWIQSNNSPVLKSTFILIGDITSICFLVASGTLYLVHSREDGSLCVISAYLGAAISGILKSLFTRPRPLWKYENIEGMACPKDWGSPSGHSMAAGTPMIMMFILLRRKGATYGQLFLMLLCIGITAFDRLYIGAHFYFQVILGYSYALLIASVLIYLHDKGAFSSEWLLVVKTHIFMLGIVILSYVLFVIKEPLWNDFWEKNFKDKCEGSINSEKAMNKNLSEGFLGFVVAGFIMGKYLLGTHGSLSEFRFLSFGLFFVSVWFSMLIDKLVEQNLFCLGLFRYLLGVFMSAELPLLLSSINKIKHKFG